MERLRPDDHFMILTETEASPMHIGALQLFTLTDDDRADFFKRMRDHIIARLPATPLLRSLRHSPFGYDSDGWVTCMPFDPDDHIHRQPAGPALDETALRDFVARWSMERLDLHRPPFTIDILDRLADGRGALLIKVHHALADGIGFQSILAAFADDAGPPSGLAMPLRSPFAPLALLRSWRRFRRERPLRALAKQRRNEALAAIRLLQADPITRRAKTPVLKLSGPTSRQRNYATLALSFPAIRATARSLDATVNDLFLAIAGTALRAYLLAIDDLPAEPLVATGARSYRRAEHGDYGNRIVAINPGLATDRADPLDRLRAIQASMANERTRTPYDEAMLDHPETPFGPRKRRRKYAALTEDGAAVLPGNLTLSNVPGPAIRPTVAGYRQLANFPTPLLASGRFLNVTSRRNGDTLDMGIMADAEKITDLNRFVALFAAAADEYARIAVRTDA